MTDKMCSALLASVLLAGLTVLVAAPATSAATWAPKVEVTDAPVAGLGPIATAVAPDGTFVVAWAESGDGSDSSWSVQVATRASGAAGFSAPVQAGPPGATVGEVVLVVDGSGATTVAWVRQVAGQTGLSSWLQVARRPRGASGFDGSETLDGPGLRVGAVSGVGDEEGRVTLLWTSPPAGGTSSELEAHSATWGPVSAGWSAEPLTDGGMVAEPALAVDGAGSVTATWLWTADNTSPYQVQTRTRPAGSTAFGSLQTHSPAGEQSVFPGLASNAVGDTVLAWWQHAVPFTGWVLKVADRESGAASFRGSADAATTSGQITQSSPHVALDDAGDVTIAWENSRADEGLLLVATRQGHGDFAAPTRVPTGALGPDAVSLSGGPDGAAILTWTDQANGAGPGSWVARAAYRPPDGLFGEPMEVTAQVAGGFDSAVTASVGHAGDVHVAWVRRNEAGDNLSRAYAQVLDAVGPDLHNVVVPATATAGAGVAVSASATDLWSGPPSITWSFGDGGTGTAGSSSHVYAAAGTYDVRVTATDRAGNTTSATRTITVGPAATDTTAPVLSGARLRPGDLPTGEGARLRLTSSERAALSGVVQRRRDGRWRGVGTKHWSVAAGANDRRFYGKTSEQRLRSGTYRVRLTATDPAGNTSATTTLRFRVDRRN